MMICMYCYGQLQIRCMHIILCNKTKSHPTRQIYRLWFRYVCSSRVLNHILNKRWGKNRRQQFDASALFLCASSLSWAIRRCRLHLRYGEWCKHHATTAGCSSLARASKSSSYKASLTCEEDISGSSGPIRKKGVSGASSLRRSVYVGRPKAIKRLFSSTAHVHFSYFNTSSAPLRWYCTKSIHSQDCCKSQTTWLSFKWLTLSQEVSSVARRTSMARLVHSMISSPFSWNLLETWPSVFKARAPRTSVYSGALSFKRLRATSNAIQWAFVIGQQEPVIVITATLLPGFRLSRKGLNFSCKWLLSQLLSLHSHSIHAASLPSIVVRLQGFWRTCIYIYTAIYISIYI